MRSQNNIAVSKFEENKDKLLTSNEKQKVFLNEKIVTLNENKFKQMMNRITNSFSLSIFEFIKFFFWPFGEVKKKK